MSSVSTFNESNGNGIALIVENPFHNIIRATGQHIKNHYTESTLNGLCISVESKVGGINEFTPRK